MIAYFFDLNKCKKKMMQSMETIFVCLFFWKKKFALIFHRDVEFFKSSIS